jgi:hypothetical protein
VEGLAAIATLGAGPVGFGDRVDFTNATLLNMTCRADGVLLQPSLPAVNVEAYFADRFPPQGVSVGMARITSAPTFVPFSTSAAASSAPRPPAPPAYAYPLPAPHNARARMRAGVGADSALFLSVFATFAAEPIAIAPIDLWPQLPMPNATAGGDGGDGGGVGVGGGVGAPLGYYVQMLSRTALCVDGAPAVASGCASFSASANASAPLLTVDTGPYDHEVYSVSPVLGPGWALLGELAKFARVSASRVAGLDASSASCGAPEQTPLCASIVGAAAERVSLAFVDPHGLVRIAAATLDAGGAARVACTCDSAKGTCGCSV